MKKIIFALMLAMLLFLASCRVVEQPVEDKKEVAAGPSGVKEISKGAEETPVRVEISAELKALLDKSNSVESLKYFYQSENDNIWFYVKGNKMKQVFSVSSGTYAPGTMYDTVYLDTSLKTAVAYCESKNCDDEEINKKIDVDYNDFITETPFDLITLIRSKGGELKPGTIIDKKETFLIEIITEGGYVKKIWIWKYKGIPVKYEIWKNGEKIKRVDYTSLSVDTVEYSDLIHQNR